MEARKLKRRQMKKYYKQGRVPFAGRLYSRKMRNVRMMMGNGITFEDYVKHAWNIRKLAVKSLVGWR